MLSPQNGSGNGMWQSWGVHLGSSIAEDQTRGGRRQVQDQLAAFSKQGESYGLVSVSHWKHSATGEHIVFFN